MNRDRLALGLALILTVLYAGAMAAALLTKPSGESYAKDWSARINPAALHILGGVVVVAIVLNLARGQRVKP